MSPYKPWRNRQAAVALFLAVFATLSSASTAWKASFLRRAVFPGNFLPQVDIMIAEQDSGRDIDAPTVTSTTTLPNGSISNAAAPQITQNPVGTNVAIPSAMILVRPGVRLPRFVKKWSWRLLGKLLPLLHYADPGRECKDSLRVLWCKAIASMDRKSSVRDAEWTYDMLPDYSRWILLKLIPVFLYPRLIHAVIETRTAYLNYAIQQEMARLPASTNVRIISFGAGYDVRCCRLVSNNYNPKRKKMEAWEFDLPQVIEAKQWMLERLKERRQLRKNQAPVVLPNLCSVDLNDADGSVRVLLEQIVNSSNQEQDEESEVWHTIFISEGVFLFLNDGVPERLWRIMRDVVVASGGTASFCWADRIISGSDDRAVARTALRKADWELIDWCVKLGRARHMGVARAMK